MSRGRLSSKLGAMPRFLLQHRHEPHECGVAFAAFRGHASPLRHRAALASCTFGGHAIWWEVETRRKLGLTATQAFESATVAGGRLLGLEDIGHLRPGARGDFVLLRGDAREGPLDVRRIRTVAKGGVLFVDEGAWIEPHR